MSSQAKPQICIATVIGKDRVGIIARLAVTFAKSNVNILDVDQRVMEDTFVMTMAVDISKANVPISTLKRRLDRVARSMGLQITLHDERIFEAMHRI
ncbi:MAG: ACT domain-containing protein [Sedimentisphaerales bacterium]|jgi:ACT domain-containing protein|nr:ACT domain-containing protein [Sedimentisphaerales bacterium]